MIAEKTDCCVHEILTVCIDFEQFFFLDLGMDIVVVVLVHFNGVVSACRALLLRKTGFTHFNPIFNLNLIQI